MTNEDVDQNVGVVDDANTGLPPDSKQNRSITVKHLADKRLSTLLRRVILGTLATARLFVCRLPIELTTVRLDTG